MRKLEINTLVYYQQKLKISMSDRVYVFEIHLSDREKFLLLLFAYLRTIQFDDKTDFF